MSDFNAAVTRLDAALAKAQEAEAKAEADLERELARARERHAGALLQGIAEALRREHGEKIDKLYGEHRPTLAALGQELAGHAERAAEARDALTPENALRRSRRSRGGVELTVEAADARRAALATVLGASSPGEVAAFARQAREDGDHLLADAVRRERDRRGDEELAEALAGDLAEIERGLDRSLEPQRAELGEAIGRAREHLARWQDQLLGNAPGAGPLMLSGSFRTDFEAWARELSSMTPWRASGAAPGGGLERGEEAIERAMSGESTSDDDPPPAAA